MFGAAVIEYETGSALAACCGGAAAVFAARHRPTSKAVALKRYFVDKTPDSADLIEHEILTTKVLQHPNILPYLTSFVHGRELYVISPLMDLGSCRDILNQHFPEGLQEIVCAIALRDVLCALDYLHKQLYIHRSVRASHVLVSSTGAVKLSGLRSAACLTERGRRLRLLHSLPPPSHDNSNLLWLSPELLEQNLKGYDERSDIYSVGVLMCELSNGSVPFSDVAATLMFTEKVRGSRPQLLDCSTFPVEPGLHDDDMKSTNPGLGDSGVDVVSRLRQVYITRKLSESFHNISELCLHKEPEKRPSAGQLLLHSFFKQIRKNDFLPALLDRVSPIKPESDDSSLLLLEEKLSEMDVEVATEWDF